MVFHCRKRLIYRHHKRWPRAKKQSLLQPFAPLWLAVRAKEQQFYIQHLEIQKSPYTLAKMRLFAGLYLNELIFYAPRAMGEAASTLYLAYEQTLTQLAQADLTKLEPALRKFEKALLQDCGALCSYTTEAEQQMPILAEQAYRFVPTLGFVKAQDGILGQHILAIAKDCYTNIETLRHAKTIMRSAINELVNHQPLYSRHLLTFSR